MNGLIVYLLIMIPFHLIAGYIWKNHKELRNSYNWVTATQITTLAAAARIFLIK